MVKIGNVSLGEFPLLLAPMEDVSDPPFRRLCKMHGADMLYSEFISSEGLIVMPLKVNRSLIYLIMNDLLVFRFLEVMRRQWQ